MINHVKPSRTIGACGTLKQRFAMDRPIVSGGAMARNTRQFRCEPEGVFAVLGDGWLYPTWVVGAARMREVDQAWPGAGAKLRHSFGVWPILTDDTTRCVQWDPPRRAVFIARGWPMGEARVAFGVEPSASGCLVTIEEAAIHGPVALVPRPIMNRLLRWRNAEVLRRLAYIAEGNGGADRGGSSGAGN